MSKSSDKKRSEVCFEPVRCIANEHLAVVSQGTSTFSDRIQHSRPVVRHDIRRARCEGCVRVRGRAERRFGSARYYSLQDCPWGGAGLVVHFLRIRTFRRGSEWGSDLTEL